MSDLYRIDKKAFDPFWNESHHEALADMIEAGYIVPVEPDYEAAKIALHDILTEAGASVIVNSDIVVDAALGLEGQR